MDPEIIIWIAALVVFIVLEAATTALVSLWFIGGSAAALIAALLHAPLWLQIALFLVVSVGLLIALRPLAAKLSRSGEKTNLDRIIDRRVAVTETINELENTGAVKVDGQEWSARTEDGSVVEAGAVVRILRVEGVKVYVKKED